MPNAIRATIIESLVESLGFHRLSLETVQSEFLEVSETKFLEEFYTEVEIGEEYQFWPEEEARFFATIKRFRKKFGGVCEIGN